MRKNLNDRIADSIIADYIKAGRLGVGDRLPSLRELEKRYGASRSSIANALGVMEAYGFVRKQAGKGCFIADVSTETVEKITKSVGFVISSGVELTNRLQKGVESVARRHGYHLIVATSDFDYEVEQQVVEKLVQSHCQGIVMYPTCRTKSQLANDYLRSKYQDYPIVLLDLAHPEQKRPRVIFDNYRAGYDMTRMLLDAGHRHVAFQKLDFLTGDLMCLSNKERYRGYQDALREENIDFRSEDCWILYSGVNLVESTAQLLRTWRETSDHATAVLAVEDTSANCIINVGRELGVDVPDDLHVVGFDDLEIGHLCGTLLTTTCPDHVHAGEMAMDLLIQMINGKLSDSPTYVLPVPIKSRPSLLEPSRILSLAF